MLMDIFLSMIYICIKNYKKDNYALTTKNAKLCLFISIVKLQLVWMVQNYDGIMS